MKPFEIIPSGEICGLFSLFVLIDLYGLEMMLYRFKYFFEWFWSLEISNLSTGSLTVVKDENRILLLVGSSFLV